MFVTWGVVERPKPRPLFKRKAAEEAELHSLSRDNSEERAPTSSECMCCSITLNLYQLITPSAIGNQKFSEIDDRAEVPEAKSQGKYFFIGLSLIFL